MHCRISGLAIGERRYLFRDQTDQKNDDRRAEQQQAHIRKSASANVRVQVMAEPGGKEKTAERQKNLDR